MIFEFLKKLSSVIGNDFDVIGGAAFVAQCNLKEAPKDVDILFNGNDAVLQKKLEKARIEFSLYQASYNDPGIVSDFEFDNMHVQIVDEHRNEWKFFRDFDFDDLKGFQIATLDSLIDNTKHGKVSKYKDLPIYKSWTFEQFIEFLKKLKNRANQRDLIVGFYGNSRRVNDQDFYDNVHQIRDFANEMKISPEVKTLYDKIVRMKYDKKL